MIPVAEEFEGGWRPTATLHQSNHGPFRWDCWYEQARTAGVDDTLAHLGRAVIRDYDQHGKAEQQSWCASWGAPADTDGMLALAQHAPLSAALSWTTTLALAGDTRDPEAVALRVMATEHFGAATSTALDRLIAMIDAEAVTARAVLTAHGATAALRRG